MKRLMYSLIIMAGGVIFLGVQEAEAQLPPGWTQNPTDNANGDCEVAISGENAGMITSSATQTGCRCGHEFSLQAGGGVIVECGPGYVCSSNQYNPYSYSVCLVKVGEWCKEDSDCDGGSVCDPDSTICTISSSEFSGVVGNTTADIRDTVRRFINIALGFLGVVTVIMIIYGGVLWLTAMGSDDKVQKGKNILLWAAIGAIVISIAWTISSYILKVGETIG